MFLTIIRLILPPMCILLLGTLLILVPQNHEFKKRQLLQRKIRPGNWVRTTSGLFGIVFSITNTHILLGCPDGTKHEILRSLIDSIIDSPHETGI